jgi:aminoglycoside phosphotransferase (APT) family kinase protein
MDSSETDVASLEALTAGLTNIFGREIHDWTPVQIVHREMNALASTFTSEIVHCRLPDGVERRVLCKYAGLPIHLAFGHRGGVAYEAAVYRDVLQSSRMSVPQYYGNFVDRGRECLVIEYLEGAQRSSRQRQPDLVLVSVGKWLAAFHAESMQREQIPASLTRYDTEYFRGWIERAIARARRTSHQLPWQDSFYERYLEAVQSVERERVIVHGEFYAGNILVRDGNVYPVDWESSAYAFGEIDLMSLVEGWKPEAVSACIQAYAQTRWPFGQPDEYERRMAMARAYWAFRWMGDALAEPDEERWDFHIEQVRSAATELGIS